MTFTDIQKKGFWVHVVFLAGAIFLAYGKVLKAGFINWDDLDYVFNTPDINSGISAEQVKHWFTRNYLGNYQPLPVFTYALDHAIAGPDPFVFHLHSLLWHIAATILVYCLVGRLQDNKWIAFFVALLFAIHPVQTESVSWIAARNKSMNAVFYFAAMYFYISYVRDRKITTLLLVTLFGLLAYLCKATALALPLALVAVDIWLRRPLNTRKIWLEKLPLVLAGIPIALVTLAAQKEVTFLQHHSGFGWSNIVFAGYALVQYIVHLVFPFELSVLYPYPTTITFVHIFCLLLAVVLGIFMVIAYRKGWYMWAGGILFLTVNLLPVLQLVQFGETLMADRYLYIACIGLWYPLVFHLFRLFEKRSLPVAIMLSTVLCACFLALTFFRNSIWLTEINFWNAILDKFPQSVVAHYSLGAALMKEGDLGNAELHMEKAVYYGPANYKAWRNKSALHLRQGKNMEAFQAINKSLRLHPYAKSFFTRALLYHGAQKYMLAARDLEKVLEQEPDNARAYYIKADCEEQLGKTREAMNDYDKAVFYDQREPLFLIRRGLMNARSGNKQAAFNDLDKAVALKPGNGEALYYRGITRYSLGMNPCDDLRQAARHGYQRAGEAFRKICK